MTIRNPLLIIGIALGATVLSTNTAWAQVEDCTVKCGCLPSGCGCSSDGGNGSECSASGNGCFVTRCETGDGDGDVVFAPDGSLLRRLALTVLDGDVVVTVTRPSASWETSSPEAAVARDCAGRAVRRFIATHAAAEYRHRTRVLAAQ